MTNVTRLFLADGMRAVFVGIGTGLAITYAGRGLLSAWLVGVSPSDQISFAVSLAVVIAVSLAASYLPARRASRMDPTEALRMD
jgi:ABC-type antimicrobial peptide transport system permease subunit